MWAKLSVDRNRYVHYSVTTKLKQIITDSIIRIGPHLYHIECQSKRDADMVIRMFEYDISIALEHTSKAEDIWEIEFPRSCVLYVRNHRHLPEYHTAIVKFADGQQVTYQVPIIHAQKYTVNAIFEKQLLILLPYHILRYEHILKSNKTNKKKVQLLLEDYREINQRLTETAEQEKKSELYRDMICLIQQIADYVIPKENKVRKGIGEIMGGNILTLPSDYIEKGRKEGFIEGLKPTFSFVQKGIVTIESGAEESGMSIEEFKKAMLEAGYKIPAKA